MRGRAATLITTALALLGCTSSGEVLRGGSSVILRTSDVRLSSGFEHSCVVSRGALSCWGSDADGRLGSSPGAAQPVSVTLPSAGSWLVPAAGERHSCGLDNAGTVLCWGNADQGQLGSGDTQARSTPTPVELPSQAIDVRSAFGHTCALLTDATLWCWGDNLEGQLGLGDEYPGDDRAAPAQVGADADWTFVATGQGHSCGIRAPGALYCWGRNTDAELGQGSTSPAEIRSPTRVGSDDDWIDVEAGQNYSCARKRDLSLWCWGASESGALASGDVEPRQSPTRVGIAHDWLSLSVNTFHTCGVTESGQVWCAGRDREGQLGSQDFADADPALQLIDPARDFVEVRAGRFFTCARKADDSVWCLGVNDSGQLGVDPIATPRTSELVRAL